MFRIWLLAYLLSAASVFASGEVIAVSNFVGTPAEIGQEIAETLGTDLAKSDRITLVERAQLEKALRELRLQSAGLTEPSQAKRVGKLVGADAIIVGSFYLRGEQIVINARVVDVPSGRVMSGRAANVQGRLNDLYNLLGDLANQLHVRLTGVELASSETGQTTANAARPTPTDIADDADILYVVQQGWMLGTPDGQFLPDRLVTVGDFARVLSRFASAQKWGGNVEFDAQRRGDPITSLRAIVALTRLCLPRERFQEQPSAEGPIMLLPEWARPYVYHAQQQGYIRDIAEASPHHLLTRRELARLLARMAPPPPTMPLPSSAPTKNSSGGGNWTGLVVDTRGLGMRSSMSPVILDTDGKQIYPDPNNVPSIEYIQEYGIADFVKLEDQAKRAGDNPVYVRATKVAGPARDRVIITNADAERLLQAESQSGFLKRWRVVFVVD